MTAQLRDYLKTLGIADHIQVGKIDNAREKVIGIYPDTPGRKIQALGQTSSYGTASIRLLVHWNHNAVETESAARALYDHLSNLTDTTISGVHIEYLFLMQEEPVFMGTDDNGIYEYVIPIVIYYRR